MSEDEKNEKYKHLHRQLKKELLLTKNIIPIADKF